MLIAIFITVLVNFIGLTIVLPVFGPLIMDSSYGFFPQIADPEIRIKSLTWFVACYPLGQFIGSPILGALSDVHGRKKMLYTGLLGSSLGFLIAGIAIAIKNPWLLVLGRIFSGLSAGTIAICYSSIADFAVGANRSTYFSTATLGIGVGWILGPYIGGKLPALSHSYGLINTYSLPFFVGALLSVVNLCWVAFAFKETLKNPSERKITLLAGIKNIIRAVKMPRLNGLFLTWFLFMFGWAAFMQFFSPFMIQAFSYDKSKLGFAYTLFGFSYALSQIVLTRLCARFPEEKVLRIALPCLAILVGSSALAPSSSSMIALFCSMALFTALIIPNGISLASRLARKQGQGEVLGINQSVQSLAWMMPPLVFSLHAHSGLISAFLVSSFAIAIAWINCLYVFRREKEKLPE